ncbi:hypothetical protein MHBO_005152 [Bonamia ostreae]|uniref:Uncharacterized protein n=1 Tax=Bonamia ostreae TaxID=126728 RepID=A0ABV2AV78_9EUKA
MLNEKDLMLFQDVRNRISDRLSRDLEVLIFDAQQSQKINSFVNRNKQKLDNFDHNSDKNPKKALFKETLNCLIASSDSWDESIFEKTELDSVKLPMKTKKIFDEYEEEYKKIKVQNIFSRL